MSSVPTIFVSILNWVFLDYQLYFFFSFLFFFSYILIDLPKYRLRIFTQVNRWKFALNHYTILTTVNSEYLSQWQMSGRYCLFPSFQVEWWRTLGISTNLAKAEGESLVWQIWLSQQSSCSSQNLSILISFFLCVSMWALSGKSEQVHERLLSKCYVKL